MENREYISEDILASGSDFLAHYGVKGMKWHKHLKAKDDITDSILKGVSLNVIDNAKNVNKEKQMSNVRRTASKTALSKGRAAINKGISRNPKAPTSKKISSSVSKGLSRTADNAVRLYGRHATLKGLKPEAKKKYLSAERARIKRMETRATLRKAKGHAKINKFFGITNYSAKNKKAATKFWKENREAFYESL